MERKQVQENVPVWLASDDLVCPLDRQQRGTFKGRPVFVQTVDTSGSGPDLDHTLGQLQALSRSGEGLTRIIGFTKKSGEEDGQALCHFNSEIASDKHLQVCVVSEWNEDEVALRELLLDRESEVSWKERAQFAEDIASLAALLRDKVTNAQPMIDANHILVHKLKKKAQLAGLRCANVDKRDDNELGADFGLLLVELITRQPVRAQAGDSLVAFPSPAAGLESLGSSASGIRLSVPGGGHQRSRSIGNAGGGSPSLRSSSSGVQASTPQGSLSSTSSGVHLSPRGASGGGLDLSSSGSYARRGGLFSSDELKERKKEASMKESNWELVQVKAFTAWLNGYLARRDLKINNLQSDLQDGTLLNHFIEIVNSTKMRRWTAKPNSKITMLENLSIGLAYIQKDMAIKLVGIGAEDIYNGYLKLILGLVWSLFKGLQMRRLAAGGGGSMEEGLMKWVREHTEAMGVTPTDFKYGFRDGQAFAALISRYDPKLIDFEAIKDKSPEELLPLVFELAEKHVGVPSLLEPNDLLSGDPDERAIQLYVSLFFDAFSTRKETAEFDSIIEITPADEPTLSTCDPITVPADCPIGLLDLAKQCCRAKPEERPTLSELKERLHAVVAEIAQREEAEQKKEAAEAEKRDELVRLRRLVDEKQAEIEGLKRTLETKKDENEVESEAIKRRSEEEAKEKESEEEVRRMKEVLHDAIEKMKDERREKEELEGLIKERERSVKEIEEARTTLKNEYDQLVASLRQQKEESESELKERSAKEKERSETEERETRRFKEELQERLKESEDVIHTREELIATLRERVKKSESEVEEIRRAKEEVEQRLKARECEVEAVKEEREKEKTKAKEETEEEVRRVREAMDEALEKAREEFKREREELESAHIKERQRFEAEKEELETRITTEKNEEELKTKTNEEQESEVEMTVRRLREQLSGALAEREEKAKEAEQLAEVLKEKERLLDSKHADEDREWRNSQAEAEQACQTAQRAAEELREENRRLREALGQSQVEADQARVRREIEADEVRQLREQLAQLHSVAAAAQEQHHDEKRSRPDFEAEQEISRLKHMLRELQAETSADHQQGESRNEDEKLVDQAQLKPTLSETNSSGSDDGVEQSVRGEKVGLFMVGVPPTIGDGPDDAASLVAGSTAAALCMTLASPIQRVKLLLQTQAEMVAAGRLLRPYAGMRDCFRRVVAEEGLLSLWRGNVAHLLRIVSANALGFVLKDRFKNVLHVDKERDGYWKWMAANVASGSAAGLVTVLCTFSLDYARTRLASDVLRVAHPGASGGERQFSGLMDVYSQVQRREGTAGLYRGFTSSCIGVILYRGLYFGLYDSLKPVVLRGDLKDSVVASFVLGWGITLGAGLAAYPFDTICRRMMTTASEHRGGLLHTLTEIVEREGLTALWKGAAANVAYALIGAGLLVAYDRAVARAAAAPKRTKDNA